VAKPCSEDLRRRVVGSIEGGATVPEAADKDFALAAHEELVGRLAAGSRTSHWPNLGTN
jgi:hypothetical protein